LTKSIFSAKDARRIHQKDDAEEKDFITANTRSHRHVTAPSETDLTATNKKARSISRHRTGRETCCRTPGYVYKSFWFPWVPITLDGGVLLRPTHAHKIGKGRAMLFCNGFSCNRSISATVDVAFNGFQFEARGPIASARHVSRQVKSTTSIKRAAHETGREI